MLNSTKYKIKFKTPEEIINTLEIMKECGIREMVFDWRDINFGKIKKRSLIKACRKYGKVRRRRKGFYIHF